MIRHGATRCIHPRRLPKECNSAAARSSARVAPSVENQCSTTQLSGRAHKSLLEVTCGTVLSAPIKRQKAPCVTSTSSSARKTELLLRQTRRHFPLLEEAQVEIKPIEKGGSDRRFYRVCSSPEHSLILVKYNLEQGENRQYVQIAQFLSEHEIRAPKIYFHDPEEGLIWIEDLGEADLWSYRNESWRVRRPLYVSALDEVAKLHCLPTPAADRIRKDLPTEFDTALYLWEQQYFFENCLGRYFGVDEKLRDGAGGLAGVAGDRTATGEFAARARASRFPIAEHHYPRWPGASDRFPRECGPGFRSTTSRRSSTIPTST